MLNSKQLFEEACRFIPGGVNSPVRAFKGVDGGPLFVQSAKGPYIVDVEGNTYIDYVGSWGPTILGHAPLEVLNKVSAAMIRGFTFGAPTEIEVRLAQKICELMPAIEKVRMVSTGTEAAMSAIRLARGFTKRKKIIKFAGCYHGHADSLLVSAGSGGLTFGIPSSAGVNESVAEDTLVAEYNNIEQVIDLFIDQGKEIAAVIVEPVAGNMNLVLPTAQFLPALRKLCDQYGSLLIFDEVITGFRVALGGAQAHYGVKPDLTILGKIIGGGFPAAAFGGRADVMDVLAPLGPVYQAGTLSGHPLAMTAGLATLEVLCSENFHHALSIKSTQLIEGLKILACDAKIPFQAVAIGGMFGLFFTEASKIENEADVKNCQMDTFKRFFRGMLQEGIYLAPSAFEIGFMSSAHQQQEIDRTLAAAEKVFATLHKEETSCGELSRVARG